MTLNDTIEYESYIDKAFVLSEELFKKESKRYVDLYVKCLDEVANHAIESDVAQSLAYRLDGLKLINEMYQKEPEVYVKTMGRMYMTTYLSYVFAKDYNNAMAMMDSALTVYQPFYKEEPQAFGMLMATCYFNKGRLADAFIEDNDLAIANYQKAIPLYEEEMNRAIDEGKQSVAQEYLEYLLSIRLYLYGLFRDKEFYTEALEQLDELLRLDPNDEEVRQEKQKLEESLQNK